MNLRPYQQNILDKVYSALRQGFTKILVCLPTGGGKTAIASEIIKRCNAKGNTSIMCLHRQELLKQTYNTYLKNGLTPAFIKSGLHEDVNNPCQIAMINTLATRLDRYPKADVIILDEAHHQRSSTWRKVSEHYKDAVVIGLSATPCRLDGKPLGDFFETMVEETTTAKLIDEGYLVSYDYYAPSELNEDGLTLGSNGEYTKASVENVVTTSAIIGNNIETYKRICNGKRNVVFAVSCNHGKRVCDDYKAAGITAEYLDGGCTDRERRITLERFARGETKVLVNVDLFGEGFDLPAIEVVSLLRPTYSTALYLQQVGRALRPCPELGKTKAVILDHVNNWKRHGLPDDERQWSLDGTVDVKKSKSEKTIALKRCPICFYAHKPALKCPNCGYEYKADGRTIDELNGNLVMIGTREHKSEQRQEVVFAKTLDDLVRIEKKRGYRTYWAERQWQMKTGEDLFASIAGLSKIAKARGYAHTWVWRQKMIRKGID